MNLTCNTNHDLNEMRTKLEMNILMDIDEFGKPAYSYNYHHAVDQINMFDNKKELQSEFDIFEKDGFKKITVDKEFELNTIKVTSKIHVLQKEGRLMADPLALSIGYMVWGYAYIEIVDYRKLNRFERRKNNRNKSKK